MQLHRAIRYLLGFGLFLLLLPSTGLGDIYRHIDANGVVHFTNTPTGGQYSFYRRESGGSAQGGISSVSEVIRRYASQFSLEEALVRAVIKAESDYNPRAVSRKGAMGMMQLIPETARLMKVTDPFDVDENIRGGTRYLRMMFDQFDSLDLALAAYNAGPGAVRRYGGVPPYHETRAYVEKVKKLMLHYRSQDALL